MDLSSKLACPVMLLLPRIPGNGQLKSRGSYTAYGQPVHLGSGFLRASACNLCTIRQGLEQPQEHLVP